MTTEDRYALLESWLASVLPGSEFGLAPASSDASFRRYFRLTLQREAHGARTLIAMDAPPPMEDCRPFVHVAALSLDPACPIRYGGWEQERAPIAVWIEQGR